MKKDRQPSARRWIVVAAASAVLCWSAANPRTTFSFQKPAAPSAAALAEASSEQIDQARGSLDRFLDAHPEIQNDIMGDPNRIADVNYVREHASLDTFLDAHPLIKADPRSFISRGDWRFQNRRSDTDELLSWFVPLSVFVCGLLAVLWVLRTVLENRRWNKSFKVHEDVHTKLIEKFSSGADLTAYMESDAGRRLLEWTPPAFESGPRSIPAAALRIMWSLQAGLILGLVGYGLLSVRDRVPTATDALLIFGTVGLALGVGFVLSAIASFAISSQLGLLKREPEVSSAITPRL